MKTHILHHMTILSNVNSEEAEVVGADLPTVHRIHLKQLKKHIQVRIRTLTQKREEHMSHCMYIIYL